MARLITIYEVIEHLVDPVLSQRFFSSYRDAEQYKEILTEYGLNAVIHEHRVEFTISAVAAALNTLPYKVTNGR